MLIDIPPNIVVHVYEVEAQGGARRMADVWLEDEEAHSRFYERRVLHGRLHGRVGTRRHAPQDASRVSKGENALAYTAIRQAGLTGRIAEGRAFL